MKKRILSLLLCLSMALSLCTPALAAEDPPERGTLTYSVAITPQYEDAHMFTEGLAAVKLDGKWGYINTAGETVVPFQYDLAYDFNEGYAVVGRFTSDEEAGQWYSKVYLSFIDKTGKETPFIFSWYYDPDTGEELTDVPYSCTVNMGSLNEGARVFYNGLIVLPGSYGFDAYDTTGQAVALNPRSSWSYRPWGWQITEGMAITGQYGTVSGAQEYLELATGRHIDGYDLVEALGYYDDDDEEEDYREYYVDLCPFNQGLAPVRVWWEDDVQGGSGTVGFGFINTAGEWVIEPKYTDLMSCDQYTVHRVFGTTGLAMVKDANGQWGAIDKEGNTVIPFQYEELWPYNFGLAAFKQDGKYGYLDEKGQVAIPARYALASFFSDDGYAAVSYDGTNVFLIDAKGNRIPGAENLDKSTYFLRSGYVYSPSEYTVIRENGKCGYGHVEYLPPLPDKTDTHGWAYSGVVTSIENNLVPTSLQNLYLNNITREEFCNLMVKVIEAATGKDIEDVVKEETGKTVSDVAKTYPFIDTTSTDVIAGNALGIISGRGNGVFDPYAQITRQEAAVLMAYIIRFLGEDTVVTDPHVYADGDSILPYFRADVAYMYQLGLMVGTNQNVFDPLGKFTREQAFIAINLLYTKVTGG